MSAKEQVTELAERRRLLLMESELHRGIIGLECLSLRGRFASLRAAGGQVSSGSPWFVGGAALAGLLVVRHWRTVVRWLPQALTLWRVFRGRPRR